MQIINFDNYIKNDIKKVKNINEFFPTHPSRILISGSSSSGKSNIMLNILTYNHIYDKIYIYTPRVEDKYQFLLDKFPNDVFINTDNNFNFSDIENLQNENKNRFVICVIIDDHVSDNEKIYKFIIRSRKLNVSIFFITQEYHKTSRILRSNCNYVILTKIPKKDVLYIYKDISLPITLDKFNQINNSLKKFDSIIIDKNNENDKLKIRLNFDSILVFD